jgi:hypothetical protein
MTWRELEQLILDLPLWFKIVWFLGCVAMVVIGSRRGR